MNLFDYEEDRQTGGAAAWLMVCVVTMLVLIGCVAKARLSQDPQKPQEPVTSICADAEQVWN